MKKSKRNGLLVPLLIIFLVTITVFGIVIEHGVADVLFTQGTIKEETYETTDKESNSSLETPESTIPNTETTNTLPEETTIPQETTTPNESELSEESPKPTTEENVVPEQPTEIIDTTIVPEAHGGTIYLTFDDGPSVEITPYILDILQAKGIHATFFIVGYEPGDIREELVQRIVDEDHSLGLHGESHTYSKIYTSIEALESNFVILQDKIYESTGLRPIIIRFPGGSSNTVSKHYCKGIMTEASTYFSKKGFVYFDWNVDSQDAGGAKTSDEVFENVTSGLRPGRRNIVLMHDSSSKIHTLEALEAIIDYGLENGYEFKVITSETESMGHTIAN